VIDVLVETFAAGRRLRRGTVAVLLLHQQLLLHVLLVRRMLLLRLVHGRVYGRCAFRMIQHAVRRHRCLGGGGGRLPESRLGRVRTGIVQILAGPVVERTRKKSKRLLIDRFHRMNRVEEGGANPSNKSSLTET